MGNRKKAITMLRIKPTFSALCLLSLLVLIGFASKANAATRTWDGSHSTNWHQAQNWSGNSVPTSSDTAIIPGSLATYPVISANAFVKGLTVKNGGLLTLTSGTLAVDTVGFVVEGGGIFTQDGGVVQVLGSWSQGGIVNANGGSVRFAGTANIDIAGKAVVFSEDFSSGGTGWTFGGTRGAGDWSRATPSSSGTGAPNAAWDGEAMCLRNGNDYVTHTNNLKMTGLYPSNLANNGISPDNYAVSPPISRPTGVTNIDVEFRRWLSVASLADAQVQVLISKVASPVIGGFGTNWTPVFWESNVGYNANNDAFWKRTTINIQSALTTIGSPNVFYVIFNMGRVDGAAAKRAGLYIDDLRIIVPGELSSFFGLDVATTANATVRFNSAVEIRGNLTLFNGSRVDLGSFTHKIHGNFNNNSGTVIVNDSVVEFIGAGPSVIGGSGTAAAIEPTFLYEQTFDSGNGSYVQTNVVQGDDGADKVWAYDATGGRSNTGGWRMDGWNTAGVNRCRKDLTSATMVVPANTANLRLSYWHNFDTEQDYDHYFLEYSTNNGGSFAPVPFSTFLLGQYNGYVGQFTPSGRGDYGAALQQQEAWTGNSGGWKRVLIDLDTLVVSKPANLKFRWRYEQDSHANGSGVRIDEARMIGASTTIVGNGLFEMVVRKDNPTLRVTATASIEIMNRVTIEEGILSILNGPTGEFLVGGGDTDSATALVVENGGTIEVNSGNLLSDSTGLDVVRLRVENGGIVDVNGGTLRLGPAASIDDDFDGALELEAGGTMRVDGGTFAINNPNNGRAFDLSIPAGDFIVTNGTVDIDGDFLVSGTGNVTISGGVIDADDDFNQTGGDITMTDGRVRVRDDWNFDGGTVNDTGGTWEAYGDLNANIQTNAASITIFKFEVNKSGANRARILDPLIVSDDFSLLAGEFDHSTGNDALSVGGDFLLSAGTTYNRREATVTFNGIDQDVTTNANIMWDVVVANSGTANFNDSLTICDQLSVSAGGHALIKSGSTLHADTTTVDAIVVDGILEFQTNTIVRMPNGSDLEVNSGGELRTAGTDPSAANTRVSFDGVTLGSGSFDININTNATLNMVGARVCDGVVRSAPAPRVLAIANSEFCSLPNGQGDAFIDISDVNSGFVSFRNLKFSRGSRVAMASARNIKANANTTRVVVGGYSGDLSGETWDNDPENNVLWADMKAELSVNAGGPVNGIYSLADAFAHLPQSGGIVTIRSTWTNTIGGRQFVVPSFNMEFGRLRLPAFNGTLNLDGFEFHAGADGISIDLTDATANATVNLFNCVVADPQRPAGARALVVPAAGTINASFCTIDSSNQGTAGLSSATNCLFAVGMAQNLFVDFGSRNLRLTSASAGMFQVARDINNPRDIDGKLRPATTSAGAHHYHSEVAKFVQVIDIADDANANSRRPAVIYNNTPSQNSAAEVAYMTGSDGTNVYLSIISRTTAAVVKNASWAGARSSFSTYVQCEDDTNKYWVYVPYDSNGDGSFDRIRRLLHTKSGNSHTLTAQADMVLKSKTGNALDFASAGGWGGQIFVQNGYQTRRFGEFQVSILVPASNGQVHVYFVNAHSSSGNFFSGPTFANETAETASESFYSNTGPINFNLNPNSDAVALLYGTKESGHISLVRYRDGSSAAAMVQINRANGNILNSFTGPGLGGTMSTEPTQLFNTYGMGAAAHSDSSKVTEFDVATWASQRTLDLGLAGYGSPLGVLPFGWYVSQAQFFVFYNPTTGVGAVAAVEYDYRNNANATFDLLTGAYSDNRRQYNAGGLGGFVDGIALVQGKPTALVWSPLDKTMVLGTESGLLYGWTANAVLASDNTNQKGNAHSGFPIRVPAGRITDVSYVAVNDAALQAKLNMAASGAAIAVFNDLGQMLLIRSPKG